MATKTDDIGFGRLRVLVVDDDEFTLGTICFVLRDMGVSHISRAASGDLALDLIGEQRAEPSAPMPFDVVICDWMMTGISGLDALCRVRAIDPRVPFLMVTAKTTEGTVLAARAHGVSAYITKPVTRSPLEAKVSVLVSRIGPAGRPAPARP